MWHSKKIIKIITPTIVIVAASAIFMLITFNVDGKEPFKNQKELETFAAKNQPPGLVPLKVSSGPLCSNGDSAYSSGCTLASTYIYKLDDDFRTEGKEVFSYLKSQGFDFKPKSKYIKKTSDKLNDQTITDNMTNTEPIMVDLYHDNREARVMVKLGDRKRTLSFVTGSKIDALSSDQLMLGLYFYSP